MNDPAVPLVDEPTGALDHERGAAVLDLLVPLARQRSAATVVVTHDRIHPERWISPSRSDGSHRRDAGRPAGPGPA